MAIFGKNGLEAGVMYLAALFAIYGMKDTGFKDDKEIDAIAILVARKAKPDKGAILAYRTRRLQGHAGNKRYTELLKDTAKGQSSEFVKTYQKKEWLR